MGTLFMVNPPAKRKKRRTAAQKAATRKMIAANRAKRNKAKRAKTRRRTASPSTTRRKRKGSAAMAAKRGRKRTSAKRRSTKRRRKVTHRSPINKLRRRTVYVTNPRRRGRRRRYGRNPAIFATLKQGAMDAGATLVGGAAARMVNGLLPLPKDGVAGAASSLAVALGVGIAARRVVGHDTARFITAGAMQVPIKNLITTFVPQAGAFLGDYDSVGAYALPAAGVGDYLNPGGMYGYDASQHEVEIGSYE